MPRIIAIKNQAFISHNLYQKSHKKKSHGQQQFISFFRKWSSERNIHSELQVRNLWLEENLSESPIVTSLFQEHAGNIALGKGGGSIQVVRYIFFFSEFAGVLGENTFY